MDARRLAAIDMWGTAGTIRRRRIIAVEFVVGLVLGVATGAMLLLNGHSAFSYTPGAVVAGIGLNYLPLSWHAMQLSPSGRLESELDGVDKMAELRRYAVLQLWLLVPYLGLWWGIVQGLERRPVA
jgi:hypothetical protein